MEKKLRILILALVVSFADMVIEALEQARDIKGSGVGREQHVHNPC